MTKHIVGEAGRLSSPPRPSTSPPTFLSHKAARCPCARAQLSRTRCVIGGRRSSPTPTATALAAKSSGIGQHLLMLAPPSLGFWHKLGCPSFLGRPSSRAARFRRLSDHTADATPSRPKPNRPTHEL